MIILAVLLTAVASDSDCRDLAIWNSLRQQRPIDLKTAYNMLHTRPLEECILGWITVCLVTNDCDPSIGLRRVSIVDLIATDWPVLEILTKDWSGSDHSHSACDSLWHPSINWASFRETAWQGISSGDLSTLNNMLEMSNGILWKALSNAAHKSGKTIGGFTNDCPDGVNLAVLIRTWGVLLSPHGDTERIVEVSWRFLENRLSVKSAWPLYPMLLLIKRIRYFPQPVPLRLTGSDIRNSGRVIILLFSGSSSAELAISIGTLNKHGLLSQVMVLPLDDEARSACTAVGQCLCLEVVSANAFVAKFLTIEAILQNENIRDLYVFADPNPTTWGENPADERSASEFDLELPKEEYSNHFAFDRMHFRNTNITKKFVAIVAEWIRKYPFAVEREGLLYLLQHDDTFLFAPEYSYLPKPNELPNVRVTEMVPIDVYSKGSLRFPRQSTSFEDSILDPSREILNSSTCLNTMFKDNMPSTIGIISEQDRAFRSDTYISHISYAEGCCKRDQQMCMQSAISIGGANVSIPLNGSFVDSTFLMRNKEILNFNRTTLVSGKTPSSLTGYYVWKPYVILKSLLAKSISWNGILVYTDAGMVFTSSMRPTLLKYLSKSDIVGGDSVMMEAHATKRDAFIALQIDDLSAALTNQIASGFVAVRKTDRTLLFLRWWLAACGCLETVGETGNIFGYPNYEGFRFTNDDQSTFSLLMKKFGYRSMKTNELKSFIEARRNIAKFVKSANSYALSNTPASMEEYTHAAETA